jgi:HEPN domain-containing protein
MRRETESASRLRGGTSWPIALQTGSTRRSRIWAKPRIRAAAERHEWACFAAQQAAEKAVKALHLYLGQEAWGHVIAKLLVELPDAAPAPKDLVAAS